MLIQVDYSSWFWSVFQNSKKISRVRGISKKLQFMAYLTPMGTQGFPRQMFVNLVQPFGQLYSLHIYQYNKTRHLYMYILCIAGQTAGPIGMIFLRTLMGYRLKKFEIIFQNFFFKIFCYFLFHGKRWALHLVYIWPKSFFILSRTKIHAWFIWGLNT